MALSFAKLSSQLHTDGRTAGERVNRQGSVEQGVGPGLQRARVLRGLDAKFEVVWFVFWRTKVESAGALPVVNTHLNLECQ